MRENPLQLNTRCCNRLQPSKNVPSLPFLNLEVTRTYCVCPCHNKLPPNHKRLCTGTGGYDLLNQSERQVSNAKISHLKQLALITVRQHYCRRWIAITTTHELPAIWAGFTLITGGNAAWHLCNFTYSLSGLLGHATAKASRDICTRLISFLTSNTRSKQKKPKVCLKQNVQQLALWDVFPPMCSIELLRFSSRALSPAQAPIKTLNLTLCNCFKCVNLTSLFPHLKQNTRYPILCRMALKVKVWACQKHTDFVASTVAMFYFLLPITFKPEGKPH